MTALLSEIKPPSVEMVVEFPSIAWEDFEALVRMKGDRRHPRILYSQGDLTLVSPSQIHEQGADRLDTLVKEICVGLGLPCTPMVATLFRRRDLKEGIEGDRTYYLANEHAIRGKIVDLSVDPPPDLAIEVEYTHPAGKAVEIWRRLGVPEVWVHQAHRSALRFLRLGEDGQYDETSVSLAFPFLTVEEILGWIEQPRDEPESSWQSRLRQWICDVLAQRIADEA